MLTFAQTTVRTAAEQAAKKPDLRAAELRVQVLSLADPSKVVDTITLDRRCAARCLGHCKRAPTC